MRPTNPTTPTAPTVPAPPVTSVVSIQAAGRANPLPRRAPGERALRARARRAAQALGAALTVALLGSGLVSARQAHEERVAAAVAAAAAPAPARLVRDSAAATPGGEAGAKPDGRVVGRGEASYYAASLEGEPTASGEPYRGDRLTAAHRSLPLGSKVRVTDLESGRSVTVRINDRGPFARGRVIDLSHAAAGRLGMLDQGCARVRLELLKTG